MSGESHSTRRGFLKATCVGAAAMALSGLGCARYSVSEKKMTNILFFYPDQHRLDWTGMNPDLPLRTPNLNKLAERGVFFGNALCPSPVCAPSRACLASGKEFDRCGVKSNGVNYPIQQTTVYTLLRDAGYHVMACGKFDLRKPEKSWGREGKQVVDGVDYLNKWGFSDGIDNGGKRDGVHGWKNKGITPGPYMTFLESRGLAQVHADDFKKRGKDYPAREPTLIPDDAYCDNWIAENGLKLLSEAPKDKPWFIQINFNGPHEPMDVTKSMKEAWSGVEFPLPNMNSKIDPEENNHTRRAYAAMIENIDRWLGIYIEELERRGELENTLIVYSSDHGEMLGDRGAVGKGKPYQASAGVPMVVAGPGVRQGVVCDDAAATLDLTSTFLDFAGQPTPEDMDSRSLKPFLEGKSAKYPREYVLSGLGNWRLVYDGRYKLIEGLKGGSKRDRDKGGIDKENSTGPRPLLFDLKEDPGENNDIAAEAPEIVERLEKFLPQRAGKKG